MKVPSILYAEDDSELREMTAVVLSRAGYNVTEASDGIEALNILQQNPGRTYLLITDIQMPRMTGDELILEAHKMGISFYAIIIASASYVGLQLAKLIADRKAVVLQKPFCADELFQTINGLINS